MKITVNQYAKTLYAAVEDKSRKEIDDVILNLTKILQKNNQVNLFSEISKKFNEIWDREEGIVEAEIITSRKLESHQIHQIKKFIKEKYLPATLRVARQAGQAKEVVLHSIIDEKIKGGIIIRVGDEILDASVKQKLDLLKNVLTK